MANDTNYGLAVVVWSADEDRALGVARQVRTGTVGPELLHPRHRRALRRIQGLRPRTRARRDRRDLDRLPRSTSPIYASTRYPSRALTTDPAHRPASAEVVAAYFAGVAAGDAAAVADLFADGRDVA